MAESNTRPAGIAPASRIPLYQVKAALHCASAAHVFNRYAVGVHHG